MIITEDHLDDVNYKSPRKWTLPDLTYAYEAYVAGAGMLAISTEISRSETAIARALTLLGVKIRPRGRMATLTPVQKRQITRLLKTHTQQEVADKLGIGRFRVQRIDAAGRRNAQHQVH